MRWICIMLVVFTSGCAASRYEKTNIELRVEVLHDFYPQAYLSGRANHVKER